MIIGGLDIATVSGLAFMKDGVITASTFKADLKQLDARRIREKRAPDVLSVFGDDDKSKALDAAREGVIAYQFRNHLRAWLIENQVDRIAIEAPIATNNTRRKAIINTGADMAGQAIRYAEVSATSLSAIFRAHGLEMVACEVCWGLNIPVDFIGQGTWRKSFLGTGRPSGDPKKAARDMCATYKIDVPNNDAAEAAGLVWHFDKVLNPYATRKANDLFAKPG